MRALVSVVLVWSIIALLLIAGCTFNLKNADGSLNTSFSTNPGTGTGTTTGTPAGTTTITNTVTSTGESTDSGTGSGIGGSSSGGGKSHDSGSSTGNSLVPDKNYLKAYFHVDCSRSRTSVSSDSTSTTTTTLKGDVPVMVLRNWNREPAISSLQDYGSGPYGGEAKLDLHSELIVTCKKPDCKPCHWIYNGPAGVGVSIKHDPKDAPADWTAALDVIGTPTTNSVSGGTLDQYTANLEPACGLSDVHAETMSLYYESVPCFDVEHESMLTKPFTYGDGSKITYTSTDPEETFDSTAVFHFSG
jgi:hypothetical protein